MIAFSVIEKKWRKKTNFNRLSDHKREKFAKKINITDQLLGRYRKVYFNEQSTLRNLSL